MSSQEASSFLGVEKFTYVEKVLLLLATDDYAKGGGPGVV